ncbi:MAG: hypothetical protein HYX41_07935 [Bdellovibrio sp.]|nr:hypothetical protein [Bdellovibrio sp.]
MSQVTTFEDQRASSEVPTQTRSLSRQEYNRMYYLKTKERREKKGNMIKTNVLQLFASKGGGPSDFFQPWAILRCLEVIALVCLSFIMTYFLIREAATFYLDAQESPLAAYLKAGMVEGVAILFSFSRGKSAMLRWSQRLVVVLLCTLTLWTLSGRPLKLATQDVSKARLMAQAIDELEAERIQKEGLRNQLVQREWLGAARKYERGLDDIREKLNVARKEFSTLQAPQVVLNSLGILIAFRFLVVLANLICFHRLAEQLGLDTVQKRRFLAP